MQTQMENSKLRAFVFGGTGGVGRELVKELLKSSKWSQVTVLVRKPLADWHSLTFEEKQKLDIQVRENLEELTDYSQWNLSGYSSVFCCLGAAASEVSNDVYIKVNVTYPANAAKLAAHFKVPHYSLISGKNVSSSSWIPKAKARGIMEEEAAKLGFPMFSIFKPGIITGRAQGERLVEKIFGSIPFYPKISAQQVGLAQRIDAELQHSNPYKKQPTIYTHTQIHELIENGAYPEGF